MSLPVPSDPELHFDQQMKRFAKYPWLPIPLHRDAVSICCPTGQPLLDRLLLRTTILLEYLLTARWVRMGGQKSRFAMFTVVVTMAFAFVAAVVIESIHAIINTLGATTMYKLLWLLSAIMLLVPSVLILKYPEMYNPLAAFLVSVGLAALPAWASHVQTRASIEKSANQRWLPSAEIACDHLLNLCYTIKRFQRAMASSCGELRRQVAQLDDPQNLPIKLFIGQQCDNSASRFGDIANQLESAFAAWTGFIRLNCQDGECEVIFNNLRILRARLEQELANVEAASEGTCLKEIDDVGQV